MPKRRPFASRAQARFMAAKHPRIFKRMTSEAKAAGNKHPIRGLPNKVRRRKR